MSRMQRDKGAKAERYIVNRLKEAGFDRVARNLEQTRSGGFDILGLEPLAIEVKDQKQLRVAEWWRQAVQQAREGQIPVLAYHRPGTSIWRVILPLSAFCSGWEDSGITVELDFDDAVVIFREIVGG